MFSYAKRKTGRFARPRSLAGTLLGVAVLVMLPAAVALACVPQASIGFDSPNYQYNAGKTVTVTGSQFPPNTPVALTSTNPSSVETPVANGTSTNSSGGFQAVFTIPADAANGDYVVKATAGTTVARGTLRVVPVNAAPPAPAPASGGGGVTPTAVGGVLSQTPVVAPQIPTKVTMTRSKAIAMCNKKHSARKAKTASAKKRMARKRAACIKQAKKKYRS